MKTVHVERWRPTCGKGLKLNELPPSNQRLKRLWRGVLLRKPFENMARSHLRFLNEDRFSAIFSGKGRSD
jgi:hypothetical protein